MATSLQLAPPQGRSRRRDRILSGPLLAAVVGAGQLAALLLWSLQLYRRYSLSMDFGIYYQAWWSIGHLKIDPYSTFLSAPFWRQNGEFIFWPLASLAFVARTPIVLLALQDAAVAGTTSVALLWLNAIRRQDGWPTGRAGRILFSGGVLLLVLDPWLYWTASFDWHVEPFIGLFTVLALFWLYQGHHKRAVGAAILTIACGSFGTIVAFGIGVTALCRRDTRRVGIGLIVLTLIWMSSLVALHATTGSGTIASSYGYLARTSHSSGTESLALGVLTHPTRILVALWRVHVDVIAIIAGAGLLGLFWYPWGVVVPVIVLVSSDLYGSAHVRIFAFAPFQESPALALISVGTVVLVARAWTHLRARSLLAAYLPLGGAVAYVALWAFFWIPVLPSTWVHVSSSTARTLSAVARLIPSRAEVVASQGIVGRFSDRSHVYVLNGPGSSYPVARKNIYFVVSPYSGIETVSPELQLEDLGALVAAYHARLLVANSGIYLLRVSSDSLHGATISVPDLAYALPAWALETDTGVRVVSGPVSSWRLSAARSGSGYLAYGASFRRPPGSYLGVLTISTSEVVTVEVWDDTAKTLLARASFAPTNGVRTVSLPVRLASLVSASVYSGSPLARVARLSAPPGDEVEIRVTAQGLGTADLYSIQLMPAAG